MKREIKKYLFDIKISIDTINEFLGEKRNFFEYQENKLLRRGIEREIEIIGEAINGILKIDQSIKIENARQIVDTRNWVIHGYDKVDDVVMWGIVSNHLPKLKNVNIHKKEPLLFTKSIPVKVQKNYSFLKSLILKLSPLILIIIA